MNRKRLMRSRRDSWIGGVCGGIGDYLNLDPVFIRVIFLVFLFTGGMSVPVYLLLWIIMPEEPRNYRKHYREYDEEYGSFHRERKNARPVDEDDWSDF